MKRHLVSDIQGVPLAELTTAASANETTTVLERIVDAIPPAGGIAGRPRDYTPTRPGRQNSDRLAEPAPPSDHPLRAA